MDTLDLAGARRFHLTDRPLTRVVSGPTAQPVARKPIGLWWALGAAWLDHIARPNPRRLGLSKRLCTPNRAYEVTLWPDAHILTIRTAADLMDVSLRFGCPEPGFQVSRVSPMWERNTDGRWCYQQHYDTFLSSHNRCGVSRLDWAAVAAEYQGVEMAIAPAGPLCDRTRTQFEWADIDWAVPSGCVWSTRAVSSVIRVPMDTLRGTHPIEPPIDSPTPSPTS